MKHEDFSSLAIEDVLGQVMAFCRSKTQCATVHWISAQGLERVHAATDTEWESTFASADVVGAHMWSQPASDLFSLFQLWRVVDKLLPRPHLPGMAPHMLTQPAARFVYPLFWEAHFLGVMVMDRPKDANPVALVGKIQKGLELASRYMYFSYQLLEAKNLSYIDELTGLYNQRYLPMVLEHEIQRCKREKNTFCLLFLDIDFFKSVNDGRGHWVGSRLLVELGHVLKTQVRSCDYAFRYGGDEFIVVLGNTDVERSKIVAERIRKAVESRPFQVEGHELKLTVSIGLAGFPEHGQTAAGLIQIADQAMYYGKRKSRNIVFVAS